MRVLVTGGAGFIGSTIVDRLVADAHDVVVLDDLSTGKRSNLDEAAAGPGTVELVEHDVRDDGTEATIEAAAPEVVCHLAAQIDVRVSVTDPVLDASINVIGTLRVLEGARRAGTRKVIMASSGGTIYGEPAPSELPVDESHPQVPLSPYGVSKKVASDYLEVYRVLHGLRWLSLALANVYGPRQDPHGEAGVVAIFAERLLAGDPCTIFGDGSQTRDFVYVGDVADAFVRGLERGSGLVNIGTGDETSVTELFAAIATAARSDAAASNAPARVGELARSALLARRAGDELGWGAGTSLADGLALTVDWFRAQRA